MWERVEKDCGWETRRAPSVRLLFGDERATPALLEFLGDTRVGQMPGLALFGAERVEERLDEVELWPQAGGDRKPGEDDGPGPP